MTTIPLDGLENRPYFFDKGISFICLQCGSCCVGEPGTIYVSKAEIKTIAGELNLSVNEFTARYLYPFKDSYSIKEDDEGRCLFFDDGCSIYDARPMQCRTYPFWFDNLRSIRHWQRIASQCPGIGRGHCYTRTEILERIRMSIPF